MTSKPPNIRPRFASSQGVFLMRLQRSALRGLNDRWIGLQKARSVDSSLLQSQCDEERSHYEASSEAQLQQHRAELQHAVTRWDQAIDDTVGSAELRTLETIQSEQSKLAKLKSNWKDSQQKQKAEYEGRKQKLSQDCDGAKQVAIKTRDGLRQRLENEKNGIDHRMHETREWVGIKTSNPVLINWTAHDAPANSEKILAIESLGEIAKTLDACKKQWSTAIARMESHPIARYINVPILAVLGIVLGAVGTGVAYSLKTPPLIWVASGLVSAIVAPALLALAASPLINRTIRRLFPPIVDQEKEAHLILSQGKRLVDQQCTLECNKLDKQHQEDAKRLEANHKEILSQLHVEYERQKEEVIRTSKQRRHELSQERVSGLERIDTKAKPKLTELNDSQKKQRVEAKNAFEGRLKRLQSEYEKSQAHSVARWTGGIDRFRDRVQAAREGIQAAYPDWNSSVFEADAWARSPSNVAWPIGTILPKFSYPSDHPDAKGLSGLEEKLSLLGEVPIAFDLIGHGALVLDADAPSQERSHQMMREVLLRAVTSLPAGSLQTTIIDPEGLGKKFTWLMHLADVDPSLVNHRVWTQPIHIADQLALTARHVEDVIQQSLRNRYRNLYEYNLQAGPMAIPYRLIVWSGFPFGLDDHSWQSLCSILSSGGRCGVGVILQLTDHCAWPTFADKRKLEEFGLHVRFTSEASSTVAGSNSNPKSNSIVRISTPELSEYPISVAEPPDEVTLSRIMKKQLIAAENIGKRIVPFESIAPASDRVQKEHAHDGLEIPIGISDAGRIQSISLGTGTSQHVLIAGKTGSGKSSLLHTLISSAALNYPPEELRMVLLDFKKGVEFQVYAELGLSHADIIGIESKREFGLSTLEYLDRIMTARGEAFRAWGVQDLPTLKRKHPEVTLPRVLIVIDEFQEMFVEDDKVSQHVSMLMDRIVRQGRSFGMHLILASQTLGGAYSLPRTTLSQMAVRIALQCDSSDAMLILSEDNTAAERLRHSGQGIYNEIGGRPEGNQNFQVSYLPKIEQLQRLGELPNQPVPFHPTTNALGRRIVFEGHKPATWDRDTVIAAFRDIKLSDPSSAPWVLGDSVSIEPPIIRQFSRAAGRNAMIVATEEGVAASLIASWLAGWREVHNATRNPVVKELDGVTTTAFWILDGSRNEDARMQQVVQWSSTQAPVRIAAARDLDVLFQDLSSELEKRLAAPNENYPSLYLIVLNLSRFRELRRSEEFSYSGDDSGSPKPDAVLSKLLSDGPPLGIHTCIWADSASSLGRWLSRGSLRDIELRILTQMSTADSNQLIDSNVANRLDRYLALVHDDADGKSIKLRPFLLESIIESRNAPFGD
ncbi:MAG: FtsK/SpoIIIE domain-containing protein [Planctomycetota bacterium]